MGLRCTELVERLKVFLATALSYFGTSLHDLYNPSHNHTGTTAANRAGKRQANSGFGQCREAAESILRR